MNDWIGLAFIFGLLIIGLLALRRLAKPATRTTEEFERNAADERPRVGRKRLEQAAVLQIVAARREVIEFLCPGECVAEVQTV